MERFERVKVHGALIEDSRRFSPVIETAVCRVVQEALTNVARHVQVYSVNVVPCGRDNALTVVVSDAGAGYRAAPAMESSTPMGLVGMQERAEELGVTLTIESAPGKGARIAVSLPLACEVVHATCAETETYEPRADRRQSAGGAQ
jgi:two-component system sensor histidine kinase NreB